MLFFFARKLYVLIKILNKVLIKLIRLPGKYNEDPTDKRADFISCKKT